ncbi:MAG: bifunctional lysylphosphatidylglycerol flippase/synthetase MprF [Phycisphaerae bacterium]|nr:bifunctional lysylphosphatidylglycerol flippase/synthetase MprF [Phycisphaerae bacterium]
MSKKIFRYFGSLAGICLFCVALVIIHHRLKQYHFSDIMAQVHQTPFVYLLLAVLLTVLDYTVLTFYDTLALRYLRHQLRYPQIAFASFVGYVFGHNLTILGGSTAKHRIYSALGISTAEIAKLIVFCSVTFWLGFFSLAGIVFIFLHQQIPAALHIPLVSVKPLGFVFIAAVIGYVVYAGLSKKPLKFGGWEFARLSPAILLGQIVLACTDWLLACGVLYVLLPAGTGLSFFQFVGIFLLAQIAGLSSYIPGGLGVFETVILLLLAPLVEPSAVFGALLLYRLIYYLIPFGFAAGSLVVYELITGRKALRGAGAVFGKWTSMITPQFLALTSFVAGIVLLFSGALPAVRGRMSVLRDMLPLPAIELSHFLASIAGALLLLLARGLQRRINIAYHLTIILLVAGTVFSLLKGFDYEEAVILSVILLAFLPCRREFYRKAALFARRFEPLWFLMVAIVIICSTWVGFFSYRHLEYSNQLWWQFAFHSDAPRFLRAASGAVIVVLLYAVTQLLLPRKPKMEIPQTDELQTVRRIVNSSPEISANLALLGDKHFLLNDKNNAFIMYGVEGRSWIAMGDPVGPEDEWGELLWKFREFCSYYDGWPVFYQIENTHLDLYLDIGMSFLKLGEEARVNMKDFSLEGALHRDLRQTRNKIQKQDYTFEIIPQEMTEQIIDKLRNISDMWLKEKNAREKRFSLGSFSRQYIENFPIAIVRKGGDIKAFANIWATGQKEELSVDLMRQSADCPNGIMDYLFAEMMLWGKEQGYEWFNLGMAPLSGLTDNTLAPLWHRFGTFVFRHGEHFYNFNGLRHYKQKFNPVWQPRYLACPRGLMLPRILTNLTSLVSGGITGAVAK